MTIKSLTTILTLSILTTNYTLLSMKSLQEKSFPEDCLEKEVCDANNNHIISNIYYSKKTIDNGSCSLEFENNSQIKITRDEKESFIKLGSQQNALSMAICNPKNCSHLMLVLTQKFNFNLQHNALESAKLNEAEQDKRERENFHQIIGNPEYILDLYNNKTCKLVKILSDIFQKIKSQSINNIIFSKQDKFIILSTCNGDIFIYDLKKNKAVLEKSFGKKINITLDQDENKMQVTINTKDKPEVITEEFVLNFFTK